MLALAYNIISAFDNFFLVAQPLKRVGTFTNLARVVAQNRESYLCQKCNEIYKNIIFRGLEAPFGVRLGNKR